MRAFGYVCVFVYGVGVCWCECMCSCVREYILVDSACVYVHLCVSVSECMRVCNMLLISISCVRGYVVGKVVLFLVLAF